jgi:GT2 family glycosyltransferase
MAQPSLVAITIVTFNSSRYIRRCFEYALSQDYPNVIIVAVDNASTDGTPEILKEFEDRVQVVHNPDNKGFAGGQNQAIALADADWVLTLNPDLRLTPGFISQLVSAAESDSTIGCACGKLLAMTPDFEPVTPPVFDSTGIYVTPNMRHFDRGSLERDRHQFDQPEFVFGATGAACLYRRSMINDISFQGEFFDNDFFAYREDADVAWRAQLFGWKCLYLPSAVAYHVRSVLPSNRSESSPVINMHSVKNRWLLRIKNITPSLYARNWLAISARDLVVVVGCLFKEWSSLRAFLLVAKMWKRAWQKRAHIMRHRRASDAYINAWFSYSPTGYAAPIQTREKIAPR